MSAQTTKILVFASEAALLERREGEHKPNPSSKPFGATCQRSSLRSRDGTQGSEDRVVSWTHTATGRAGDATLQAGIRRPPLGPRRAAFVLLAWPVCGQDEGGRNRLASTRSALRPSVPGTVPFHLVLLCLPSSVSALASLPPIFPRSLPESTWNTDSEAEVRIPPPRSCQLPRVLRLGAG